MTRASGSIGFAYSAGDKYMSQRKPTRVRPPTLAMNTALGALAVSISRYGAAYDHNFDPSAQIPAGTKTYYVDPVGGNDANAGTTRAAALQYLSTALRKTDVDQIRIINLTSNYVARCTGNGAATQAGWNNVSSASVGLSLRSISVIVEGPYRYISACAIATTPATYTKTAGRTYVYEATGQAYGVIDVSAYRTVSWAAGASPPAFAATIIANAPKRYYTLVNVASVAAVDATPGSWYYDSGTGKTYVRLYDDRDLTDAAVANTTILATNQSNGRWSAAANNLSLYVEGIDFVGGSRAFITSMVSTVTGSKITMVNCSFQGAATVNGLNIQSFTKTYVYRCSAFDCWNDGFNYHSQESDGTTLGTSPTVLEMECVAAGNGSTGSTGTSDNASTSHDDCRIIRVNGVYPDSNDRPVADTNYSQTWNLGVISGQATTQAAGKETFACLSNATMHLDGCTAVRGTGQTNADFYAELSGSFIGYRNMTGVTAGGGAGSVAQY